VGATAGRTSGDIRFSRTDDANIQGDVSAYRSDLDNHTVVYLVYQDSSISKLPEGRKYLLPPAQDLPKDFPGDFPSYDGSTVINTYYEKGAGGTSYDVSLITKDDARRVLDSYKTALAQKGWTIIDETSTGSHGSGLTFSNARQKGSLRVTAFGEDSSFTEVGI